MSKPKTKITLTPYKSIDSEGGEIFYQIGACHYWADGEVRKGYDLISLSKVELLELKSEIDEIIKGF